MTDEWYLTITWETEESNLGFDDSDGLNQFYGHIVAEKEGVEGEPITVATMHVIQALRNRLGPNSNIIEMLDYYVNESCGIMATLIPEKDSWTWWKPCVLRQNEAMEIESPDLLVIEDVSIDSAFEGCNIELASVFKAALVFGNNSVVVLDTFPYGLPRDVIENRAITKPLIDKRAKLFAPLGFVPVRGKHVIFVEACKMNHVEIDDAKFQKAMQAFQVKKATQA